MYLRGAEAFRDALNPLVLANYLVLTLLGPGALLIWLSHYVGHRQVDSSIRELSNIPNAISAFSTAQTQLVCSITAIALPSSPSAILSDAT